MEKEIENKAKELYDSEHSILFTFYFFSEDAIEGNEVAPVHLDLAENGKIQKDIFFSIWCASFERLEL